MILFIDGHETAEQYISDVDYWIADLSTIWVAKASLYVRSPVYSRPKTDGLPIC